MEENKNIKLNLLFKIIKRCTNDYLTINDGQKECGSIKTAILYEGCTNTIKVDYTVGAKAYKGFKLYYESNFQYFTPLTFTFLFFKETKLIYFFFKLNRRLRR